MRVAVEVLGGLEVTVGGAGLGVTVGGPTKGVRVANGVGEGKGVKVLVGVRVGTGVPAGVRVGVVVRVCLGVRVGRAVADFGGNLVGVRRIVGWIPPGSVGPAVSFTPSSIRIGARVPRAVGAARRRRAVSSGARLHACSSRTTNTSDSGNPTPRYARETTPSA